jgi:hypothetical protein
MPALGSVKLFAADCVRGWVTFSVPAGQRPAYLQWEAFSGDAPPLPGGSEMTKPSGHHRIHMAGDEQRLPVELLRHLPIGRATASANAIEAEDFLTGGWEPARWVR